jgi:hypothetical protein
MRSFIPFTQAVLAKQLRDTNDTTQQAGIKHAQALLGLVASLVEKTTEDGLTDPRSVKTFLDDLHVVLAGRTRSQLRTVVPVEEWDRECDAIFPVPRSIIGSTLSPGFIASSGDPSTGGVRGNN